MEKRPFLDRPLLEIASLVLPWVFGFSIISFVLLKFVDPAPPNKIVISTSSGEGDYLAFAKLYQKILKEDGINLEIRKSSGAAENLKLLADENSDVEVGFVQDGLGNAEEMGNLSSLGSLYFEPIWIFYSGSHIRTRISQLKGLRIAIGPIGGGTRDLSLKVLNENGVTAENTTFLTESWEAAGDAIRKGKADAAFFIATPDEPFIKLLVADTKLHLMSLDQAEAIIRHIPFLHHLVLPHGALNIEKNIPEKDVDLISPTATLLVKDSLHPALIYPLLKAASQVHAEPGIFEKKDEFPIDRDYQFSLREEAKSFYKSGAPFWQKHLPFWLATLFDRFFVFVVPFLALLYPLVQAFPKVYHWRIRSRIYHRYGELKYLETQIHPEDSVEKNKEFLKKLDSIEERVNRMKVPLNYTEHIYGLRGHIEFVRSRIHKA